MSLRSRAHATMTTFPAPAGRKSSSNIVNIVLAQGRDMPGYALLGCIAAGPLRCCLLGECDMDGGIDDPCDGRPGVIALGSWGEPAEHAEAIHRAVEGVAL